jgi:hypothetical protein
MHYVDSIENPSMTLAEQRGIAFQPTSKVPLYLAAFIILIGMVLYTTNSNGMDTVLASTQYLSAHVVVDCVFSDI